MPLYGLPQETKVTLLCERERPKQGFFLNLNTQSKMKVKPEELGALMHHIEDELSGDYVEIIVDLLRTLYMLHYLEEDDIPPSVKHDTCYELYRLAECFHKAYERQRK